MRVEVVLAFPRTHHSVQVELRDGARVADAIAACGLPLQAVAGYAVFGERVTATTALRDGDRVELLRPLQVDPKDARRLRAARRR
ncbi:RnfH family protein [Luteimonas sp. MC1782]|uniref:RnfH family protein n=1 Tax=Luteimonas sp. MC1782 TaxID=2760305 RepID=UPI00160324FD|nr:RnfH family protein [Luteimonas sp. MC1782]